MTALSLPPTMRAWRTEAGEMHLVEPAFAFKHAPQALAALQGRGSVGKVVLRVRTAP